MTHNDTDTSARITDARLDEMLDRARRSAWTAPDTNPRVERYIKEKSMAANSRQILSRGSIALIVAGALCGGGVAAAVTHQIMSRRATIITDDGSVYNVELLDTPEGAAGSWTMEDGTVYGINMIEDGEMSEVTVDVESPEGGTSTIMLDNGLTPKVLTAPGQKAQIRVQEIPEGAAGVFIDEDGNTFEVDESAIDTWAPDDDASED